MARTKKEKIKDYVMVSGLTNEQRLWLEDKAAMRGTNMSSIVKGLISEKIEKGE